MDSERAETYLRDLAEAELRRARDAKGSEMPRVHAVAAAFTGIGALERARADSIVEEFISALALRSLGDEWHLRRPLPPDRGAPPAPEPVSVTPIGELLELREGESDMDVYLLAAITTPSVTCLTTGILSKAKGSLPQRRRPRDPGPPLPGSLSPFAALMPLSGVPRDLVAVDDSGRAYNLFFGGGGDLSWHAGQFTLMGSRRSGMPETVAWLDVGCEENSIRLDLTARPPAAPVTTTPRAHGDGERFLLVRTEAVLAHSWDIRDDLPEVTAMVTALRAIEALPEESPLPGQIAALRKRHKLPGADLADTPAALPDRWVTALLARERRGSTAHPDPAGPPAAAHLSVVFPEVDQITTVLAGLVTAQGQTTLHGAFFGHLEANYADGPSIWLRDDTGQWHVATPGSWNDGGVIVFHARVLPPVTPAVKAMEVLIITRTADLGALVPLTWWTS